MSPHNVPEVSRVEMLADCPIDHPFFVKDKGMSHLSLTRHTVPYRPIKWKTYYHSVHIHIHIIHVAVNCDITPC